MTSKQEQRDLTIDALVDHEYQRRIANGTLDKGHLRDLIRQDVIAQARDKPGWLRQQSDRIFGAHRVTGISECPYPPCGKRFPAYDTDHAGDAPHSVPTRGPDNLLYCCAACARHEPFVTLDEWLADNPQAAAAGSFLRTFLAQTNQLDRLDRDKPMTTLLDDDEAAA